MTHIENRFPLFAYERNGKRKLSPLVGESVSGADERGKLEQTGETILTCVRTLAPIASLCSALPSVFGGS